MLLGRSSALVKGPPAPYLSLPMVQASSGSKNDGATLRQCKCGTDRDSKYAYAEREYSFLGTLYLLWGGTSVPTKVTFLCVKCGDRFDSSTSPRVCRNHVK